MNNYIKLNEDRWNNVQNDYTEPLTHEELEEVRNNPNAYMPKEIMERCEIYVDLPKDVKKLYDNAWIQIKSSN